MIILHILPLLLCVYKKRIPQPTTTMSAPVLLDSFFFNHSPNEKFEVYHLPKAGALLFGPKLYHYDGKDFDPIKFTESPEHAIDPHFSQLHGKLPGNISIHPRTTIRSFCLKHFVFSIRKTTHLSLQEIHALPSSLQPPHFNLKLQVNEIVHNQPIKVMEENFRQIPRPNNPLSVLRVYKDKRHPHSPYAMYQHGFADLIFKPNTQSIVKKLQMFMRRGVLRRRCLRRALLLAVCMADQPRLGEKALCSVLMQDPWAKIMADVVGPMVVGPRMANA